MCKQCETKAVTIIVNLLPHYHLMQATVSAEGWPAGHYGLVHSNDPDFVFPSPIVSDPFGNGEPTTDDWTPEQNAQYTAHIEYARLIDPAFKSDPFTGWRFVDACRKEGYKPLDGDVVIWFINYAAQKLEWLNSHTTI